MEASDFMRDFAEAFLGKVLESDKKLWKSEEIEREFVSAMYFLSMEYLKKCRGQN